MDEFTAALELDQLRTEIAALQDLLAEARRVRDHATDSKLAALRQCLERAEFKELADGRGKLLIFTEHRDTLNYLRDNLERWGYSTCQIHGGMNPHERKRAQEQFRTEKQICVATEAAGEGINLQFCRLMINYDLPWNPTRLEQRLGRIHRIGQERDVHAFNFVASDSEEGQPIVEGRILERLLEKLDQMRAVLDDRVFDVIGEVLSINDVNLPEMLREAAFDPPTARRLPRPDRGDRPGASATIRGGDRHRAGAGERGFFRLPAGERRGRRTAADAALRRGSFHQGLPNSRSESRTARGWTLAGRARPGRPSLRSAAGGAEARQSRRRVYRKVTFRKEDLDRDQHLDAVLVGPGHPLYAAVDERLNEMLSTVGWGGGRLRGPNADHPYRLHFL